MSTVARVVRSALMQLGVLDAEEAPKAVHMVDAMEAMNQMMARWEANGLSLGWSAVTTPTQDMPVPFEAEEAVIYNLAVRLRPAYNATLHPDVMQLAEMSLSALRRDVKVASPLRFERGGGVYDVYTDSYI